MALDRRGDLRFAPLGGATFLDRMPEGERDALPDSLVLSAADGRRFLRSAAVVESLRRVGGSGRALAGLAQVVPTLLADRLYDRVAAARRRWFRAPGDACPAVSAALRPRFLP